MSLNNFMIAQPRPLPVFILADTSGSMAGAKMQSVNAALRDMVGAFRKVQDIRGQIELSLITFGNTVTLVQKLAPVDDIVLPELSAGGNTPMGAAFTLLSQMIEDKHILPSNAFYPTVVLVSDGLPTDLSGDLKMKVENDIEKQEDFLSWEPLKRFLATERGGKCSRLAMGIGDDANNEMLRAFINSPDIQVIHSNDARGITKFFRWVTFSVSSRSVSRDPNRPILPAYDEFNDEEFAI